MASLRDGFKLAASVATIPSDGKCPHLASFLKLFDRIDGVACPAVDSALQSNVYGKLLDFFFEAVAEQTTGLDGGGETATATAVGARCLSEKLCFRGGLPATVRHTSFQLAAGNSEAVSIRR